MPEGRRGRKPKSHSRGVRRPRYPRHGCTWGTAGEEPPVHPLLDYDQLQPYFRDRIQARYERVRTQVFWHQQSAAQRARETHTHPTTIRTDTHRFAQYGMLGLLPAHLEVVPAGRQRRVHQTVVRELQRLKGLYDGFAYRELGRIILATVGEAVSEKTIKKLWLELPPTSPQQLPLLDYHGYGDPAQARAHVIDLYQHGWSKTSISRFLRVSRPTIDRWIGRIERDHTASLADHSSAPHSTSRKAWLPVMLEVYQLQKRHPDAGGFRIWSLRGKTDISVRTVERIMALNRQLYTDIPHHRTKEPKPPPKPHPYKASFAHQYWFLDGRMMDFTLDDGVKWWSIILLEGYSRTILAGAVAPSEASWAALLVLYTAALRYGAPSDSRKTLKLLKTKELFLRLRKHKSNKINGICFFEPTDQSVFELNY
jgi:hypothetical protein